MQEDYRNNPGPHAGLALGTRQRPALCEPAFAPAHRNISALGGLLAKRILPRSPNTANAKAGAPAKPSRVRYKI
jgi:hypothetical protein